MRTRAALAFLRLENPLKQWLSQAIVALMVFTPAIAASAASGPQRPSSLTCDAMTTPIGLDIPHPQLSWQLQDDRFAAKQTAYQVQVATTPDLLLGGKADVWDSGRIASDKSVGVVYGGPALKPEQRYYWRVQTWDKDGKAYPPSDITWWETGLMQPAEWRARWIGFEEPEEKAIRESGAIWITNEGGTGTAGSDSHHDFRYEFTLPSTVRKAHLYLTGRDTAAAWINGKQVLAADPLPPYKQMPWKRYKVIDVTPEVRQGKNLVAIDVTLYATSTGSSFTSSTVSTTPMSACLYIELTDGSVKVIRSDESWKAILNAPTGWSDPAFADVGWKNAVRYVSNDPQQQGSEVGRPWPNGPVKMLRKAFDVSKPVRSAHLYATALGSYKFWINGKAVGDQILSPGWTDYRFRVSYQAYDVTAEINSGANALGAYLAPGWYSTPLEWLQQPFNYGATPPALKAQLRIEHTDGSVDWIATDESWRADVAPILSAEIYNGETYDARREQSGWSTAGFSAAQWKPAEIIEPQEPAIFAQDFQPIRVDRELHAKALTSPKPGVYIYDFGQNLAGVARIHVDGPTGTQVQLRFAEVLNPDGTIYTENLRTAKATDRFILSGKGPADYQPLFTFHGFRYVELTGLNTKQSIGAVTAVVFHTSAPLTADLRTGSEMINQLWSNILWGQRSNFVGVPTDCPQRDERLGWSADAQVFWRAASYDMDLTQFSKKFAGDLRGTQSGTPMYGIYAPGTSTPNPGFGAGWSDAGVIIPWTSWLQSGDTRTIEQNWDAMEKYLAAIQAESPDYIWNASGIPFGDWLSPEGRTKQTLIATAYWAYDVTLMKQMARALGRADEEKKYADLFDNIRSAFQKTFIHSDGFIDSADNSPSPFGQINNPNAKSTGGDTQTGYVLALHMRLVPDTLRSAAADRLVTKIRDNGWKLGTGFLGTPYLLAVLVDTGHADLAYRLLLNTEYPSWGYLVGHGATTMWERWNGDQMRDDPSMNSYNHYAYGAVADWIYSYAAGIDAIDTDAGFHTIYLHPNFDPRLGSLDLRYASRYGSIRSAWQVKGATTEWNVTIPPNTTAQLPLDSHQQTAFTLDGAPLAQSTRIHAAGESEGRTIYVLPAGTYSFAVTTGK
ncbi:MAG: family 78 glycoside hydrolase catalytic domain [Silvibacterium sp.]|nr:family 78 glycoside hydrolase catalytic domain [Silvibacterium sp.]